MHRRIRTKRLLVGRPMTDQEFGETLLPKRLALPVFCSDPISSVAYATEEILLVLGLAGVAALSLSPVVALWVVVLLVLVVASYMQTTYAYPNGGGAYAVSRANLGQNAALVAASALLVDYVLTVAVSVVAGIANLTSAFPSLSPYAVEISLGVVVVLAIMNLRGVKESGRTFAVPTYGFVLLTLLLIGTGVVQMLLGHPPVAQSAAYGLEPQVKASGLVLVALLLRAFASGCTALTGVEAVSNGVPSFRKPKSRNASRTLLVMGVLSVVMFSGITIMALQAHVHMAQSPDQLVGAPADYVQPTVVAQLATAIFGNGSLMFFAFQAFTVAILVLAANTAFNGFPILASILGRDGYLPRQFSRRGDRLVFSNGVIVLAALAALLIWAFDANTTRLIQLYIIGVFVSFTLSQAGMVRHWTKAMRDPELTQARRHKLYVSRIINFLGAVATALVLVIVLITKFSHGAWIVVIAMPVVFAITKAINRHYARTDAEQAPRMRGVTLPSRVHAVVLVSRMNQPALQALAYARATRPNSLTALHVHTPRSSVSELIEEWEDREIPVTLTILDSPYRDITRPVLEYIAKLRRDNPRELVSVFLPEYVVRHWWEALLHNQSALRLKARLLFQTRVMVVSVPWRLADRDQDDASTPADVSTAALR
jgi:amino acid transporter